MRNLQFGHAAILIGGDGDELGAGEDVGGVRGCIIDLVQIGALDDQNTRLVLVHGVEDDHVWIIYQVIGEFGGAETDLN